MASPVPQAVPPSSVSGRTWARRCVQSNLVVALYALFVFFFLFHGQLSLEAREIAAAALLGCWQGYFLLCVLARRRLPWLWPAARTTAVVLFVGWQLFFLFVRNPLDFWYAPIRDWCRNQRVWDHGVGSVVDPVDAATDHYANFNGIDQNWKMFTSPLSRSAQFLAVRIEFSDGADEVILSEDEPDLRRVLPLRRLAATQVGVPACFRERIGPAAPPSLRPLVRAPLARRPSRRPAHAGSRGPPPSRHCLS